ncbi:hypothetical protein E2320_018242 [Naja naja]|nr:hypothetical protein E2320_018242 [Naja naja]
MTKTEELLDSHTSEEFYEKYEPKEILGRMKKGELFDYLTEKVTLSEKETRWSAGVIMYTLLAGSPPFWHRKQMLMLRMIMNGDYKFGSPEWDDQSDTVKDLIAHCLVVKPQNRYTVQDALTHPFFQQYMVEEVRHFSPFRKFRDVLQRDPYGLKPVRKLIDACAFRIYGHWVKKGEAQNRAALFENTPKAILFSLAAEEELL